MTDEQINKAVDFLVQQRPRDHRFSGYSDRRANYAAEIRCHLQVQAALRMAGLGEPISEDPAPPAADILSCAARGCGWVGHEDSRNEGPAGKVYCPGCGSTTFNPAAA